MPLYDYSCQECECPFETLVRSESEVVNCPRCHSTKVERLISLPARPLSEGATREANVCNSVGPPCGSMCSRFKG